MTLIRNCHPHPHPLFKRKKTMNIDEWQMIIVVEHVCDNVEENQSRSWKIGDFRSENLFFNPPFKSSVTLYWWITISLNGKSKKKNRSQIVHIKSHDDHTEKKNENNRYFLIEICWEYLSDDLCDDQVQFFIDILLCMNNVVEDQQKTNEERTNKFLISQ